MDGLCGDRRPAGAPWVIEEIPFQDVDRDLVRNDRHLFYSLAAASFVEITADLYTADLVKFYRGDTKSLVGCQDNGNPRSFSTAQR